MLPINRLLTILLLVALIFSACQPIQPIIEQESAAQVLVAKLDAATVAKIEALVEKIMQENQVPGFALGIIKDGQVVYAKGFGVADVETRQPVTPQSVFLMYSLAKSLTAPAVLQLVAAGKIDLDAPVVQYLPYFRLDDPRSDAITVRQLMNHMSGLSADYEWHFENLPRFWDEVKNNGDDASTLERHLRRLASEKLLYAPGETFSYANDGYNLLGAIIAQVSGQPYEVYMRDHLLQPFGMKNSTFLLQETDPALLAAAHLRDESGQIVKSTQFPYARWGAPSGTLFSNLDDMLRWAQINLNRGRLDNVRIVSEASYDLMAEQYVEVGWGDTIQYYGYGWFKGDLGEHYVINNAGAGFGFRSYMGYAPDDGVAVVVMGNYTTDSATEPFYTLDSGVAVMKMLLGIEE
ncbi:MAG: class A beta-lactamase-related serine hydrolase [Caldilinea sp. CFX5]|nr:class A beta-lactamase-related serine hydrolase [Caldilinea sp. CFX5]